jgi:hypothetical protein
MSQRNKLRFFHTTDLDSAQSTWLQVYPCGPKKYEWKQDKNQIYYRKNQKGGYTFINERQNGRNDFDFFNEINDLLARCVTRFIVTQENCGGNWTTVHIGKFTMNDGEFDLDKCTIKVKQSIVDEYSCLEEGKDEDFNIISVAPSVSVFSPEQNNFEFLPCRNKAWLGVLDKPCDATGKWKLFYDKVAANTPQPKSIIYNDSTLDDYYNCVITKNHSAWIEKTNPSTYNLNIYRFVDSNTKLIGGLDGFSRMVVDKGLFGFILNAKKDFKVYRRDSDLLLSVITNHISDILWFDVDDELGFAFYYDANDNLFSRDLNTGITRLVANVNISTDAGILNMSYGDGLLAYHDDDNDELIRYNPLTFVATVIASIIDIKFLYSEDSFLTWFNIDDNKYYLQNRDDSTFENIEVFDTGNGSRWYSRENEWLVIDDDTVGAQQAINLINTDTFFLFDSGAAAPTAISFKAKIENGWYLFHSSTISQTQIHYLDSYNPSLPTGNQYKFTLNKMGFANPFHIAAGIERIYIAGKSLNSPFNLEMYSVDMDTQALTLIETLNNDLNCLLMNGKEQIISTSIDRVDVLKEDIQRNDELRIWFREKSKTVCVGGLPISPGAGWILLQNQCNQFGTSTWVKTPSLATPNPSEVSEGGCVCTDEVNDLVFDPDECTSINPNSIQTNLLMLPNTALTAGIIRGPLEGITLG